MVLPAHLKNNLMPSEIKFIAENELITILPRYSMKKIELIGTTIPALRGMRRERVPIWVALILKSQDKCNIVPPEWMNVAYLKEKYEDELKTPYRFSDLPSNWIEVSKILLTKAADDLADPSHQLRSIIQDLREIRLVKSRRGLKELNESNIELLGLSLLEINELRPFVLTVMNKLRQLHDTVKPEDDSTNANNYEDSDEDEDMDN
ncbi:DNA replication protein psf2 [Cerrena zonata]|uniref:DNA replication complex GINS protein PSF2 n=1 Tax=Cerrena zonata TaxID=2478898 RepID=A0AAW0G800_9APHY